MKNYFKSDYENIIGFIKNLDEKNVINTISNIEFTMENIKLDNDNIVLVPNNVSFNLPNDFLQIKFDSQIEEMFLRNKPKMNINYFEYNKKLDEIVEYIDMNSLNESSSYDYDDQNYAKEVEILIEKIFI